MKKIYKLSIAMIVKNEEWILEKCLESLNSLKENISYEIIIVDTGSKDNTINIAKKYTDKVYTKEWNNNFADMRNYSISKCNGEWILILDADEILENSNELINFLKEENNKKFNAATLKIKQVISNNKDSYILSDIIRLFKNRKEFFYTGRIHEQPNTSEPIKLSNISLLHYGYSKDSFNLMNYKYERNLKLLLQELEESDENPYIYFQLAQTYGMANIRDKAFENIIKAYNLIKNEKNQGKYLYIYQFLIKELFINKDYEKSIELAKRAIYYNKYNLDFYYFIAKSYSILNNYEEAKIYYDEYFKLHKKIEEGYIDNNISLVNKTYLEKKDMFKDIFKIEFNKKNYKYILDNYKNYKQNDIEYIFIYSFIINKRYEYVFEYYKNRRIEDKNIDNIILACENVNKEILNDNILNIYTNLLGLDNKLDYYINYIYNNLALNEFEFDECCLYKLRIFSKKIIEDGLSIEVIKYLNKDDVYNYLFELMKDYRGIELLYNYCKDNFLSNNIIDLNFLIIVEDILIKNENIEKKDYGKLIYRHFINKINYIKSIYNKDILDKYYKSICHKNESFFIELLHKFRIYSTDKYSYVKGLKFILKEYQEYKVLIDYLKTDIVINDIDYNIILNEKEKIIRNIKILLQNNKIKEAKEILEEIKDIFKYDYEINNLLGIISYLKMDYESSLIYFGLANILNEEDFDSTYNLGLVLEESNRIEDSKFYYRKAIDLCNDKIFKEVLLKKL